MLFTVYQVGADPNHLLLVNPQDLEVINGSYWLQRGPDEGVRIPTSDARLSLAGLILGSDDYKSGDYNEILERFRNGERAGIATCSSCGHEKWENVKRK